MKRTLLFSLLLLIPVISTFAMESNPNKGVFESIKQSFITTKNDFVSTAKNINNTIRTTTIAAGQAIADNAIKFTYYFPFFPAAAVHTARILRNNKYNQQAYVYNLKQNDYTSKKYKKLNPFITLATYGLTAPALYYFSHTYLKARNIAHKKLSLPVTDCKCNTPDKVK